MGPRVRPEAALGVDHRGHERRLQIVLRADLADGLLVLERVELLPDGLRGLEYERQRREQGDERQQRQAQAPAPGL